MTEKGQKRRNPLKWLSKVVSGKNSLMFTVVTATLALLIYSSALFLASTNGVLQEKTSEFAVNGLIAGLGAAYPAVESAFNAGLSDSEVLAVLGKPEEGYHPGALRPFIIDNSDMRILEESGLPEDVRSEVERRYINNEYVTVQIRSANNSASVCNFQVGAGTWLAAIVSLPSTGKSFGFASETTPFLAHARRVERDMIGSLAFAYVYFLILLIIVLRIITNPLRSLTRAAKKFAQGDFSYRVRIPTTIAELGVLADAFNTMGSELKTQRDSLEGYSQKLEEANRKAITAVDKLSQRNREQKAMIESSLEANKLATPEEVIQLMLNRLRDDLRLKNITIFAVSQDGLFERMNVQGLPLPDPSPIPHDVHETLRECRDSMDVKRLPGSDPDKETVPGEGTPPASERYGQRLYIPVNIGIGSAAILELVARPGAGFDSETEAFCRYFATHMEVIIRNKALYQETVRRSHELERINQISRSISSHLDTDLLLRHVVEYTQMTIHAECAFVGLLDGNMLQIRNITPGVAQVDEWVIDLNDNPLLSDIIESGEPQVISDIRKDYRVQLDGFIWRNNFLSFVGVPVIRKDEVIGVICGFSHKAGIFTPNDSYFLGLLASQVSIAFDNARLFEEISARDKRRDHQLTMAQKLQKNRIPEFYKQNVAAVNCKLLPADELAGDFCDVFSLGRNSVALVVGDVANKGVAASLMTFSLLSMFRNVAKTHKPPCEIMETINRSLIAQIKEDCWFATAFYGRLNTKNGTLTYASAGHERPIWYHAETGKVEMLEAAGYPLGLFKSFPYETREIQLQRGDRIVLYTDGVTDAADPDGNRYGHDALLNFIDSSFNTPAEDLTRAIVDEVERFARGRKQKDDIIVTVLELQDDPWIHKSIVFNESNDLIGEILDALNPFELDRQTAYSIRLAIDEALANAWRHGLKMRDDLPLEVSYYISDEGFLFRVKDPGEGFDHESLPDPTVEENLYKTSGRGVFLIRKMMDEVEFNDIGNEITVFKKFTDGESGEDDAYDALLIDPMINATRQQDSLEKAMRAECSDDEVAIDTESSDDSLITDN